MIRAAGTAFSERNRKWFTWLHLKILTAIVCCRTSALGGHIDECSRCGHRAISYNSCRNRHCPKCQANARDRWLEARRLELLPTRYVHVMFTLPGQMATLALQNKREIYGLLFRASSETLLKVARDERYLGAEVGFFSVLHTWTQTMQHHPHVHCVVPAGGLSFDHQRWVSANPRFFLPKWVLRKVFRGKVKDALKQAFAEGKIGFYGKLHHLSDPKAFRSFLRELYRDQWVVHCKPPVGGPDYVLRYLGRYTHRVAISNHRLVSFVNGEVTFRWRDRAHGNIERPMKLSAEKFLTRFLLHSLPKGFVRIRSFGYLANRNRRTLLPLCFQCLQSAHDTSIAEEQPADRCGLWKCPQCGGPMVVILRVNPPRALPRPPPAASVLAQGS